MDNRGYSLVTDAGGNVYTVGQFSGTCDFDPSPAVYTLTAAGMNDIFICKLNSSGNFVWAKRIGGTSDEIAEDVALDASGNVYTFGSFAGTPDFDPGGSTYTMTSLGQTDIYVSKLDASGNFVWAKQMGGTWWDSANSIAIDGAGDIIITGEFSQTADLDPGPGTATFTSNGADDLYICKLNSSGTFVWAKRIGSTSGDFSNAVEVDNSNNILICGYFTGTTDFDPNGGIFNLSSSGFEDVYVCKLSSAGNFIWAKNMGSNTVDYGKGLAVDASGNVYTTGSFRATADFDPGAGVFNLTSNGGDDIFVSKLDASGNFLWAKNVGSTSLDVGNGIDVDNSGNVYVTGAFRFTVDFDPGPGTYTITTLGFADIFMLKLTTLGDFAWAGQMGSAIDDFGYAVTLDASGIAYTTGFFGATCDFDPTGGVFNLTSFGGEDVFVQKLCPVPYTPGPVSGPSSICGNPSVTYSIAAVPNATAYSWVMPFGWTGSSFTNSISATPGSSGSILVSAYNACGTSASQVFTLVVSSLPAVTAITNATAICAGQSASLSAGGASTYTWNTNSTSTVIVVNPPVSTTYTVTGTNSNGCQNTATVSQVVNALPLVNATTTTSLLCAGQSATLNASGANTYSWNNSSTGSMLVVSPTVTTDYTVTGTDANGCQNTSTVSQVVVLCTGIRSLTQQENLEIYPNPVQGELFVRCTSEKEIRVRVMDVMGKEIQTVEGVSEIRIDLRVYPAGIYFLEINSGKSTITEKIIKE
jgi:hypothetical protein